MALFKKNKIDEIAELKRKIDELNNLGKDKEEPKEDKLPKIENNKRAFIVSKRLMKDNWQESIIHSNFDLGNLGEEII